MTRKTVLFVDDEQKILKGLRRMLYPLRKEWDMFFVTSGAEALETMQDNKISIVISDMRMPGMNGVQLLQTVQERSPEVVRVMLTGHPDTETYREVMTISHYFLWKPTSFQEFEALLSRIQNLEGILEDTALKQLVGGVTSLPSLPILFTRLTTLLEQTETDCAQIAALIKEDMAMAAQILKLVNSAYFGLTRRIETLEDAVTYLGIQTISSLVLMQQLFSRCTDNEFREFQLDQLWEHSFCVATLAKKIVSDTEHTPLIQEHAYLAGLLHDIGKLFLATQLPEGYRKIMENSDQNDSPRAEVELDILGVDHSAIGGYLTSLWGLPRKITEAVTFHHTDSLENPSSTSPVLDAIWHANRLCRGDYSKSDKHKELVMKWHHKLEE